MALMEDIFADNILDEPDELERVEIDNNGLEPDDDDNDDNQVNEGGEEDKSKTQDKTDVKKKRVLNQRPKLNVLRLMAEKNGLKTIERSFKDVKFKGKGYEREDLNIIMRKMEMWTHQLYPVSQFDDCLGKLETLGNNKSVATYIKKIRLGMEDFAPVREIIEQDDDSDNENVRPSLDSAFDQLINTQNQNSSQPAPVNSVLTPEQRERMLKNRLIAEQRRMARLKARQEQQNQNISANEITSDNASTTGENATNPNVTTNDENSINIDHSTSVSENTTLLISEEVQILNSDSSTNLIQHKEQNIQTNDSEMTLSKNELIMKDQTETVNEHAPTSVAQNSVPDDNFSTNLLSEVLITENKVMQNSALEAGLLIKDTNNVTVDYEKSTEIFEDSQIHEGTSSFKETETINLENTTLQESKETLSESNERFNLSQQVETSTEMECDQ